MLNHLLLHLVHLAFPFRPQVFVLGRQADLGFTFLIFNTMRLLQLLEKLVLHRSIRQGEKGDQHVLEDVLWLVFVAHIRSLATDLEARSIEKGQFRRTKDDLGFGFVGEGFHDIAGEDSMRSFLGEWVE